MTNPSATPLARLAATTGILGALLGTAAGLAELTVGPHIRSWVGNKLDTTRLGIVTIALSLLALGAAAAYRRARASDTGANVRAVGALALSGLIGFTTVGRLWYLPGALLIVAAALAAGDSAHTRGAVRATLAGHGHAALLAILGGLYVFLGATALGIAGSIGVVGGVGIVVMATAGRHLSRSVRAVLLCLATIPFAALTWWSIVTPTIAILTLALGARLVLVKPGASNALRLARQPSDSSNLGAKA